MLSIHNLELFIICILMLNDLHCKLHKIISEILKILPVSSPKYQSQNKLIALLYKYKSVLDVLGSVEAALIICKGRTQKLLEELFVSISTPCLPFLCRISRSKRCDDIQQLDKNVNIQDMQPSRQFAGLYRDLCPLSSPMDNNPCQVQWSILSSSVVEGAQH